MDQNKRFEVLGRIFDGLGKLDAMDTVLVEGIVRGMVMKSETKEGS